VDVLCVPVRGGPTIGGAAAAELVRSLRPRLVLPMHYRTDAVNFLDPPDAFLEALGARVLRLEHSEAATGDLLGSADAPSVALLAPPVA
jgi:L-ascorbate metabolism protein UlaG (beta-lactamase superfamily)